MADNFIRIPPDSTGKRLGTLQHTIEALAVDIQKVHVASNLYPENMQDIDNEGNAYVRFGDGHPIFDPFHNFKVSEMNILGIYEYSTDGYFDLVTDTVSGNGNIDYETTSGTMLYETTNEDGSYTCRTTDRYHYHQPGTSMHLIITIQNGDVGKAGNIRRWGYYDDNDGVFFQLTGGAVDGGHDLVYRTSVSGTPTDYIIQLADFNGDPVNGTGKSGLTIDLTQYIQYWMSIGAGSGSKITYGIYHLGRRIAIHTLETTSIPLRTTSLPIRVENFNTDATVSGSELRQTNAILKSAGNQNNTFWRFADMEVVDKTITTETPILLCRSKALLDDGKVNNINTYPETLSVYCSGGPAKIQVINGLVSDFENDSWDIAGISTIMGDTTSTGVSSSSDTYWNMCTYYCDTGVTNIDISKQFELNDEGILTTADGTNLEVVGFVGTRLTSNATSISMTLSYRELW